MALIERTRMIIDRVNHDTQRGDLARKTQAAQEGIGEEAWPDTTPTIAHVARQSPEQRGTCMFVSSLCRWA